MGADTMTADVELLPLPEPDLGLLGQIAFIRSDELLLRWCHANVEHHTAAKDAEIERLAEEANRQESLKEKYIIQSDGWEHRCKAAWIENESLRVKVAAQRTRADAMAGEAIKHEARAEWLAETLRESRGRMLGQVKWVACDCGCGRDKPADAVSVAWLRASALLRDQEDGDEA